MENQAGDTPSEAQSQIFQQQATGYPPPYIQAVPPGYPPPYQQAFPQGPQPIYPMVPPQGLPPSPYPLQAPRQQNVLAILSIVISVLAGALNYVLYFFYYKSGVTTTTRAQEIIVLQNSALLHISTLSIAAGAFVCAIVALSYAKNHAWNGLIPGLVGLVFSSIFLIVSTDFIIELLVAANVLQNAVQ
jgi:hypothetical protein